ncbi:hypothetical protein E2P81_ATG04484 [Venturia nashicola]|uniref:Uncharacterized protein n=1 Tax=Venturia nashicola TaxID=86259 RepID=A0A4Z1PRV4_9PEZI|nr:hypothetical protein E6O75_ATG04589 [Venturia nashicola]TLD37672.1 hypothetical protein E2P81_ATG04484 [Venturia nashicola]
MSSPSKSSKKNLQPPRTEARSRKALFYRTLLNIPVQTMSSPNPISKLVAEPATAPALAPAPKTTLLTLPLEIRQNIFYFSYDTQDSRLAQIKAPQSLHKGVTHSRRHCKSRYSEARYEQMSLTNEIRSRAQQDFRDMAECCERIRETHESFDGETEWVEAKWAEELKVLEMKAKKELSECGAKCFDVKNWGNL